MRTFLTIALLTVTGLCHVKAQTLQASMLPTATLYRTVYIGGALNMEGDAEGTGVTWDFSNVDLQDADVPVTFGPASETPFATLYPAAQYAEGTTYGPDQYFDYYQLTGNKLELLVEGVPLDVIDYSDPRSVLEFPFSLGNSFTDTYDDGTGQYQTTVTYTGSGTLLTSMGNFTNVVKLTNDEGMIIFWNTTPLYKLAQLEDDGFFAVLIDPAASVFENAAESTLLLWPNPTNGQVHVQGISGVVDWSLMDVLGRSVLSGRDAIGEGQGIDVSAAPLGSYQLVLNKGNERRSMPLMRQ